MTDNRGQCAECLDFVPLVSLTRRTLARGRAMYVCALCAERIDRLAGKIVGVTDQVGYEGDD